MREKDQNQPILSIIIPTRNRQKYAIESIASILQAIDQDCEIVVQDNSDISSLENILPSDPRIVYHYSNERLSFVDNFSEAYKQSSGRYICFIGDDDTVTNDICDIVRFADQEGIDAVVSRPIVSYEWPDQKHGQKGMLSFCNKERKIIRIHPKSELSKLMQEGCITYMHRNLARAYHGITSRSKFEEYCSLTNVYFGGLSPDIYSSVALSYVIDQAILINYPFSIAGSCPESGTSQSKRGEHTNSDLSIAPHFIGHSNYEWSSIVPRFYSVETIWADTAIHAMRDLGLPLSKINKSMLYAHCLLKHLNYSREITKCARSNHVFKASIVIATLKDILKVMIRKLRQSNMTTVEDVESLNDAQTFIGSIAARHHHVH